MPRSGFAAISAGLITIATLTASGCAPAATSGIPTRAPTALPTASPATVAGGTITLTDDGCSWDDKPAAVDGARTSIELRNETADFGVYIVHRLKPEFTWEDGDAAIAAIQEAMANGEDWPNWSTNLSTVEAEGTAEAGATGGVVVPALTGTYGIVCSANTSPTGDVLTVFLVGPLEVTD